MGGRTSINQVTGGNTSYSGAQQAWERDEAALGSVIVSILVGNELYSSRVFLNLESWF